MRHHGSHLELFLALSAWISAMPVAKEIFEKRAR
jgi:hypothetical protein